ncbi:ERV/ALR sulfhydryl oxidase domain-containing protein [Hysterangium stoloniferum]|nr:ERV/ALR sulfhydryl oxidase domain-containing protein [Hysterangium stoloniferum]
MSEASQSKPLKPGMPIGPDGKPCRVCSDGAAFRAWRPPKLPSSKSTTQSNTIGRDTATTALTVATAPPPAQKPSTAHPTECPPDSEQLGRATWTFLHTTAAYYPDRPNPVQSRQMRSLLTALPTLYPCSYCASHLGECMKNNPPDVSGRAALSRWLCDRHNEVNERLGKPLFDCSKTDERWKDGPSDGSCD